VSPVGGFHYRNLRSAFVKTLPTCGQSRPPSEAYLERKINNDLPLQARWRAVHLIMWEAANGPLPAGHAIAFKNGDKKDLRLDNFELITRAALMRRNTIHNFLKDQGALRKAVDASLLVLLPMSFITQATILRARKERRGNCVRVQKRSLRPGCRDVCRRS
jgi:hypothetical protein